MKCGGKRKCDNFIIWRFWVNCDNPKRVCNKKNVWNQFTRLNWIECSNLIEFFFLVYLFVIVPIGIQVDWNKTEKICRKCICFFIYTMLVLINIFLAIQWKINNNLLIKVGIIDLWGLRRCDFDNRITHVHFLEKFIDLFYSNNIVWSSGKFEILFKMRLMRLLKLLSTRKRSKKN